MTFPISATLLDALVLAVAARDDTYGYRITQDIRIAVDVSESTLYPVLRRLQKEENLETYDREFQGRNRRYYRVTPKGRAALELYREEWKLHRKKIEDILLFQGITPPFPEDTNFTSGTLSQQGEEKPTDE